MCERGNFMKVYTFEQGTPEWTAARLGIPTASSFSKIITPGGKASESADGYANELIAEIIAGESSETFEGNKWTVRGKDYEADAVLAYEAAENVDTEKVGFVTDDKRTMGCSPDRYVGKDGMLEIKVPAPKTHIATLLKKDLAKHHYPQVMGQLLICEREWVDLVSFHHQIPKFKIRIYRDEKYLFEMTRLLKLFHDNLNEKKQILINDGIMKENVICL